jgi:rhomboid protease GluP
VTTPSRSDPPDPAGPLAIAWDAALPATRALTAALVLCQVGTAIHAWRLGRITLLSALFLPRSTSMRVIAGGQLASLVAGGQPWRVWTAAWLHGDAVHLAVNVTAILAIGRFVEPWVGRLRLWSWFWTAAVAGGAVTHLAGVRLSDGASGGAFGLLGAAVAFGVRHRARFSPDDRWLLERVLPAFLLANLVLSFALPFINAAGHVGGLIAGLILGGLWRGRLGWADRLHLVWVTACVAIVAYGLVVRRVERQAVGVIPPAAQVVGDRRFHLDAPPGWVGDGHPPRVEGLPGRAGAGDRVGFGSTLP